MKTNEMIKEAYEELTNILIFEYSEKGLDFFTDFDEEVQDKGFKEMQLKFPEITIEDIETYQETTNWTNL